MTAHAILSPSSAHRWMVCPGSVVLEVGRPDVEREEQAEGTLLHEVAAALLRNGLGAGGVPDIDDEQREAVQAYVDSVREYASGDGDALYVEQRVPVGHVTGEAGAEGTADAIVLTPGELQVHDAKFGRVRVVAERNPQTMLYALGALEKFELTHGPFERVRLVIHQPRLAGPDEWVCSVDELREFGGDVVTRAAVVEIAQEAQHSAEFAEYLNPGESQCHYCKAKAVCPALADKVQTDIGTDFETIAAHDKLGVFPHNLGACARAVPLIRMWCNAVDEELTRKVLAGERVEGFKAVRGREGNREWSDAAAAEKMLTKQFRLTREQAYTRKLISPTGAEEIAQQLDKKGQLKKGHEARPLKPSQWEKLQSLIARSPAPLKVVPVSDKREAVDVAPIAEHFADESAPATVGDLL